MKTFITILLVLIVSASWAQTKPKQHVFYDTVTTVKERVDFSPDTIPVYFKEIVTHVATGRRQDGLLGRDTVYERLSTGFVIWQTYRKASNDIFVGTNSFSGATTFNSSDYYTEEYKDHALADKFLYLDKTPVTNKVIYAIKR